MGQHDGMRVCDSWLGECWVRLRPVEKWDGCASSPENFPVFSSMIVCVELERAAARTGGLAWRARRSSLGKRSGWRYGARHARFVALAGCRREVYTREVIFEPLTVSRWLSARNEEKGSGLLASRERDEDDE
jgi:hypothetical protein